MALRENISRRLRALAGTAQSQLLTNGLAVGVSKFKGVAYIAIIARITGLAGLGVWAQLLVVIELIASCFGVGLWNALVRFYPHDDAEERRSLVWTIYAMTFVGSLIGGLAILPFTHVLASELGRGARDATSFALLAVIIPGFALVLVGISLYRAADRLHRYSALSIVLDGTELAAVVIGAAATRSVTGAAAGYAMILWLQVAMLGTLTWRMVGRPSLRSRHVAVLRYSLPLVPSGLSNESLNRADRLIVGAMLGPASVGIYTAAYGISSTMSLLALPFTNVLFPKLVRSGAGDGTVLRRYGRMYLALGAPLVVALVAVSPIAVRELAGSRVAGGLAAELVALCASGIFLMGSGRIAVVWLYATDRTVTAFKLVSLCAVLNVALNLVLIPTLGVAGAAFATLIAFGLYGVVPWRFLPKTVSS